MQTSTESPTIADDHFSIQRIYIQGKTKGCTRGGEGNSESNHSVTVTQTERQKIAKTKLIVFSKAPHSRLFRCVRLNSHFYPFSSRSPRCEADDANSSQDKQENEC